MAKSVPHEDIESTKGTCEVDYLHKWIVLVADVMGNPVDQPDELGATDLVTDGSECFWNSLPEEYLHLGKPAAASFIDTDEEIQKRD